MLRYRGFWRMALRDWRTGLAERRRSRNRKIALSDLQRMVPELKQGDLQPGRTGVRAMALVLASNSSRIISEGSLSEAAQSSIEGGPIPPALLLGVTAACGGRNRIQV